jgi:hypothetical protein
MALEKPDEDLVEGGPYQPGPNKSPGGGTTVDDVTPGTERSPATTHSNEATGETG